MRFHIGLLVFLSVLFVSEANSQEAQRPDFGGDGIFSYVPPQGWKVVEFPGLNYRVSHGAPANEFAPNINVMAEAYSGPLENYARAGAARMKAAGGGFELLKQTDFTTSDGLRGVKAVFEVDDRFSQTKRRLRQTQYLFNAGPTTLVVTCSTLADGGTDFDQVFDTAMKTFRVTKGSK